LLSSCSRLASGDRNGDVWITPIAGVARALGHERAVSDARRASDASDADDPEPLKVDRNVARYRCPH
jgi:hypothetical protein